MNDDTLTKLLPRRPPSWKTEARHALRNPRRFAKRREKFLVSRCPNGTKSEEFLSAEIPREIRAVRTQPCSYSSWICSFITHNCSKKYGSNVKVITYLGPVQAVVSLSMYVSTTHWRETAINFAIFISHDQKVTWLKSGAGCHCCRNFCQPVSTEGTWVLPNYFVERIWHTGEHDACMKHCWIIYLIGK